MDCRNCGAPLKTASAGDYLVCEYCDTIYFPEASRDNVRVLGDASPMDCPVCHEPLVSAEISRLAVLSCARCHGILARQGDFALLVKHLRANPWGPEALRMKPLERKHLARRIDCPQCHQPLNTHPYYGPGNVVIDNCIACGLVWLDYGELYRIVHAPGRDRVQPS